MRTYDENLKVYWDNYSVIETAKHEGREQGREEGLQQGRQEERLEIAREMKKEGDPIEKIVRITGLSEEQIQNL
jgi:predicted transposase/invertase (TIGR01784 family)